MNNNHILEKRKQINDNILKSYGAESSDMIEKSKKGMVGETRTWQGKKYKKQSNGKWLEVSESHGLTRKEHEDRQNSKKDWTLKTQEEQEHMQEAHYLSDEEKDDSDFEDTASNTKHKPQEPDADKRDSNGRPTKEISTKQHQLLAEVRGGDGNYDDDDDFLKYTRSTDDDGDFKNLSDQQIKSWFNQNEGTSKK